jgi:hypothetical protein
MIATGRFVFLHLHKSGGTFVNECLMRFVPDARPVGYHLPRSMIPPEAAALPVIGLVRSPWSYYVSWYSFQRARPNPNVLFRILSDDGRLDFEKTLRNMLDLGADGSRLDALLRLLPTSYGGQGLNLPGFALAPIRHTQLGFYAYLYNYLYAGDITPVVLGRLERVRDELLPMLESVGERPSPNMRRFVADEQPRNPSSHADYVSYYTPALRDLVALRDASVIERHGYVFGAPDAPSPPRAWRIEGRR